MHLTVVAMGSRGDMQPYLALAVGMMKAGYEVQICTDRMFEHLVISLGLPFQPVTAIPMSMMQQKLSDAINQGVTEQTIRHSAELFSEKLQGEDGVGKGVGYIQVFLDRKSNRSNAL